MFVFKLIIPKEGQPITAHRQYKSHQHSTKLETFCKAFTSPICKTLVASVTPANYNQLCIFQFPFL
jgi:hypothetical protein